MQTHVQVDATMYLIEAVCWLVMQGHLPQAGVNEDNLWCKEQKWSLNLHLVTYEKSFRYDYYCCSIQI